MSAAQGLLLTVAVSLVAWWVWVLISTLISLDARVSELEERLERTAYVEAIEAEWLDDE